MPKPRSEGESDSGPGRGFGKMARMSSASFNRPGAIDLSQLAARARQQTPPQGAAGGRAPAGGARGASGPNAAGGGYVLEVTDATFEADTIRRSTQYPVVVEFYSPRAGASGEQLSATLAALAAEADGRFLLTRLNVDGSQIPQMLGVQAVPTVIGMIGGQLAPLFQGSVPREQASAYIDQLLQAAVANGVVGRAEPVGGAAAPDEQDEPAVDPRFAAADEALERGDFAAAEAEFDKLLAADPGDAEAKAGKAQAGLLGRTVDADPAAVLAAASEPGAGVDAQLAAADVEMVQGQAEAAFARLVGLVRTSAGDDRERIRLRLLELFETLGNADPRVAKGRRDLMTALF